MELTKGKMVNVLKNLIDNEYKSLIGTNQYVNKNEDGGYRFKMAYTMEDLEYFKKVFEKEKDEDKIIEIVKNDLAEDLNYSLGAYLEEVASKLSVEEWNYFENKFSNVVEFVDKNNLAYVYYPLKTIKNNIEKMILVMELGTDKEYFYHYNLDPIDCLKTTYAIENGMATNLATEKEKLFERLESEVVYGETIACIEDYTVIHNRD